MEKKLFRQYLVLVIPGLIIFTIGLIVPLFLSLRYSVTSWDGMSAEKTFVGLKNYVNLFKDKEFIDAWWFTIKFTIGNTIIQNVLALLFAVALDSGIRWQKVYRTALFVPCLISAIIVGFIWLKMFSNVLPEINEWLGTNINFLLFGDSKTVLGGLLIANNWQWDADLSGGPSVCSGRSARGGKGGRRERGAALLPCDDPDAGSGDHDLRGRYHDRFAEGIRPSGIFYKRRSGKSLHLHYLSDLYDRN